MSQTYLKGIKDGTDVLVGYDRPLRHFFLTVFETIWFPCSYCEEGEPRPCGHCRGLGKTNDTWPTIDEHGSGHRIALLIQAHCIVNDHASRVIEAMMLDMDPEDLNVPGVRRADGSIIR